MYILLLIAYSDLKEADTDFFIASDKKPKWNCRTSCCAHPTKWKKWHMKTDPEPSAANIAEKVLQK